MHGNHAANVAPSRRHRKTIAAIAIIAVLACIATAGLTLAWYSGTSSILNPFTKGAVDVEINEQFDPATGKNNVTVSIPSNTFAVDAYVRAHVDVYWQDAQGNRLWEEPVEKGSSADFDYEIIWASFGSPGTANAWLSGADGHYYWSSPVAPGASTDPLIVSCTQNVRYTDGRVLVVDISTQAVQADPNTAFNESWGPHAGFQSGGDAVLTTRTSAAQGGAA